jgi:hypothetical protein
MNQAGLLGVDFVGPICEGHQAPVGTALVQGVLAACLAAWPLAWGAHYEAMPVGGRAATRHGQCDVGSRYISADGGTGRRPAGREHSEHSSTPKYGQVCALAGQVLWLVLLEQPPMQFPVCCVTRFSGLVVLGLGLDLGFKF